MYPDVEEATPLQTYLDTNILAYAVVSIIFGIGLGYVIGGQKSLRSVDRILLGSISGLICGILVSILMSYIIPANNTSMLIAAMSSLAGTLFGVSINWAPAPKKGPKRHVYFELDDDEEFDRQIEEALRGSSDD